MVFLGFFLRMGFGVPGMAECLLVELEMLQFLEGREEVLGVGGVGGKCVGRVHLLEQLTYQ